MFFENCTNNNCIVYLNGELHAVKIQVDSFHMENFGIKLSIRCFISTIHLHFDCSLSLMFQCVDCASLIIIDVWTRINVKHNCIGDERK